MKRPKGIFRLTRLSLVWPISTVTGRLILFEIQSEVSEESEAVIT